MQVTKFGRTQGLAPVGKYFEAIARDTRDANEREAQRQTRLAQEDCDLEALYRRKWATRARLSAEATPLN